MMKPVDHSMWGRINGLGLTKIVGTRDVALEILTVFHSWLDTESINATVVPCSALIDLFVHHCLGGCGHNGCALVVAVSISDGRG